MKLVLILCLTLKFSLSFGQADASVIVDTLDNGFTYYIKPMEKANGKIYMDLVIRSGSNQEKKHQFNFAHFVEHLPFTAFRTKAKKENKKLEEAIRSQSFFLNGNTSYEFTGYSFHFPASDAFLQDQGLSFLAETLFGKLFPTKENFEAEKGAIYQEIAKVYFGKNSFQDELIRNRFNECASIPINPYLIWNHTQNYKVSEAKDFIKKWYRPELSSLVVVGEIKDINKIRTEIQNKFSSSSKSSPIQQKPCKKTLSTGSPKFTVIDNQIKDPEYRSGVNMHLIKKENHLKSKFSESQWGYLKPILSQSISKFLWESHNYYNSPTRTVVRWFEDFPLLDITIKSLVGEEEESIKKTFKFLNLLKYQGISKDEWSTMHSQGLKALDFSKTKSAKEWLSILKHQSLGKNPLSAKEKKELLEWWEQFTMEDFNTALRTLLDQNTRDFVVIAPFSSDFDEAYWKEKTKALLSKYDPNFLIKDRTRSKTFYKELERDPFGSRVFQLTNGQKVIINEKTKEDQGNKFLDFHAFQNFGAKHFDAENYYEAMLSTDVIKNAGVGQLDKYELKEVMTTNSIQKMSPYVTDNESGIKGKLSGQNLAVFFDLLQDYFDSPRKDSLAFKDWQHNQWRKYLNPGISKNFSDTQAQVDKMSKLPRIRLGVYEKYKASKKITTQNAYHTYTMIFGKPEDFTILISSSYKAEQLLPYLTKIFNGTSKKDAVPKRFNSKDTSERNYQTNVIPVSSIPNANAMLALKYLKKVDASDWKTQLKSYILEKSLGNRISPIRYFENKALYFWTVTYYYHKESNQASISLFFPTLEEQVEEITKEVKKITRQLKRRTISKEELDDIKSKIPNTKFGIDWESNSSLTMKVLYNYYKFNILPPQKKEFEGYLKSIRPKDIKAMAKDFFTKANKNKFIALPST